MTPFPEPRPVRAADITLSVHEAGAGPAVVLCHGFPELARSWRHQFGAIADAGFRVIAPDQRGYGGSEVSKAVEDYDIAHLTGDLVGLLDALEIERAVFAGHDWGGARRLHHSLRAHGLLRTDQLVPQRRPQPRDRARARAERARPARPAGRGRLGPSVPPATAELTRAKCSDAEVRVIEECGHWTQQEKPEELTGILVDWLVRRFGEGSV